ncbi:MAG: dodecin family protein [Methanothrix sp.]|nr:dodecin family protein [Methanothrix sp.]
MPFKNLGRRLLFQRDNDMYSIIEIVGKDSMGWEYAVKNAIDEASENLRDLRIAHVKELDIKIYDGKISEYRAKINLSFKDEK